MIRGVVAGIAVALLGMTALFSVNFGLTQIPPDHYRRVVEQAVDSGTLATVMHLPLAPNKDIYPFGGNDCLILGALVMPRDARMKASVSPRMPVGGGNASVTGVPGYPPAGHCLTLAATMQAIARNPASDEQLERSYYHRYIHGDTTVAALLLAIMPFGAASDAMLAACYVVLAAVALLALLRMRADSPAPRRHAAAFLTIAVTLMCFYAMPLFDRSFSFAPTDLVVFGFILYGLLQPLGRIPQRRFVFAAAAFGTLIAIFEFLTGGVPLGLATLITLIALGGAPDWNTLRSRAVAGAAAFTAAVVACFAFKLLAVAATFGTNELSVFFQTLSHRMGGAVEATLSDSAREALKAYHIDPQWLNANYLTRIVYAGLMLTYSSFFLGLGSHLVGAAIVLLPTPLLLASSFSSLRHYKTSELARERLATAAAGIVPVGWYVVFANHTIMHSSYMVRPLALNLALCIVAAVSGRQSKRL
jgi:hypothetical protein